MRASSAQMSVRKPRNSTRASSPSSTTSAWSFARSHPRRTSATPTRTQRASPRGKASANARRNRVLPLPRSQATNHPHGEGTRWARIARRSAPMIASGITTSLDRRLPARAERTAASRGSWRYHRSRQHAGHRPHRPDGAARQVVGRDPVPDVPDDRDAGEAGGDRAVHAGLQRVGVDDVWTQAAQAQRQPDDVGCGGEDDSRAAACSAVTGPLAKRPGALGQREHLGRDARLD